MQDYSQLEWFGVHYCHPTPEAADMKTHETRARYDRIAWMFDQMEFLVEAVVIRGWRRYLWSQVPVGRGLEVGVGTGKNIPYYPPNTRVAAVDISPKMLRRAGRRERNSGIDVELVEMDVEHLAYPADTFDWAVATFVFCSVPDPVRGLRELARVVKPSGRIFLLEHVRIDRPVVGKVLDLCNPVAVWLTGANINRRTVKNVAAAGLTIEWVENLAPLGLIKFIAARP